MNATMITCPGCGAQILLSEALKEQFRHENEARLKVLASQAEQKARAGFAAEKQFLEGQLVEERRRCREAQQAELELRKEREALETRARELDLEPEAQFALLCWDTLRAAEFRFNEAKLLGHAVGMDVSSLEIAGLISVKQDQVKILSASERRRDVPLTNDQAQQLVFGFVDGSGKKVKKADALKIHPRDPAFRTHLDKAQALALADADAGGGAAGIGSAKSFTLRHSIKTGDATVGLIEALLKAAPPAVRRDNGAVATRFAEFRAWHAILLPVFDIEPPTGPRSRPTRACCSSSPAPAQPATKKRSTSTKGRPKARRTRSSRRNDGVAA